MTTTSVWPAPRSSIYFCIFLGRRPDGTTSCSPVFSSSIYVMRSPSRCAPTGRFGARLDIPGLPESADLCLRAGSSPEKKPRVHRSVPTSACSNESRSAGAWAVEARMRRPVFGGVESLWGLLADRKAGRAGLEIGGGCPGIRSMAVSAWAERGGGTPHTAVIRPWPRLSLTIWILKPNVFVSTAEVFQDPIDKEFLRHHNSRFPGVRVEGTICLGVVRRRYPEVAHALDWLIALWFCAPDWHGGLCVFGLESMDHGQEIDAQDAA